MDYLGVECHFVVKQTTKTKYINIQYSFMKFCEKYLNCVFVQVRFQYTFETVAGFIVPYAIIIMSYVLILRRLRKTKFQRKVHSEKLILAIVVTFGIFWLPYHIINMLQVCRGLFLALFLLIQIFNSSLSPPTHTHTHKRSFVVSCPFLFFGRWQLNGTQMIHSQKKGE